MSTKELKNVSAHLIGHDYGIVWTARFKQETLQKYPELLKGKVRVNIPDNINPTKGIDVLLDINIYDQESEQATMHVENVLYAPIYYIKRMLEWLSILLSLSFFALEICNSGVFAITIVLFSFVIILILIIILNWEYYEHKYYRFLFLNMKKLRHSFIMFFVILGIASIPFFVFINGEDDEFCMFIDGEYTEDTWNFKTPWTEITKKNRVYYNYWDRNYINFKRTVKAVDSNYIQSEIVYTQRLMVSDSITDVAPWINWKDSYKEFDSVFVQAIDKFWKDYLYQNDIFNFEQNHLKVNEALRKTIYRLIELDSFNVDGFYFELPKLESIYPIIK